MARRRVHPGGREADASERVSEELAAEHHADEDGERANEVKPCFTPPFLPLRIRVGTKGCDAYALSLSLTRMKYDAYAPGSEKVPATLTYVVISRSSEQRLCVVLSWRS